MIAAGCRGAAALRCGPAGGCAGVAGLGAVLVLRDRREILEVGNAVRRGAIGGGAGESLRAGGARRPSRCLLRRPVKCEILP